MKDQLFATPPVVILGAARSGTKMLRALVTAHEGMHAVPYDVNYIWKYGNQDQPHDALDPALLSPRIARFIRRQLMRSAGMPRGGSGCLVEKTVGNILRIPFVSAVLPEARYVVLVRDGRDVIESAQRSWRERPNLMYLLQKSRSFPWLACAAYGWSFAKSTVTRFSAGARKPPVWGPIYPGIHEHVASLSLVEVCAHQWRSCMEHYDRARSSIPENQRIEVRYEKLVADPHREIDRLADFLGIPSSRLRQHAAATIRADNVGKHTMLTSVEQAAIERIAGTTLSRWGYECNVRPSDLQTQRERLVA